MVTIIIFLIVGIVAGYLARMRQGPRGGKVASLTEEERVLQGFSSFEITR